jgi:two-component system, LytTR family, sensor kinase
MKSFVRSDRVTLYLQIAAAFLAFRVLSDVVSQRGSFFPRLLNHSWLLLYATTLHYLLFDHLVPFIRLRWRRILLVVFLIPVVVFLCSFGLYGWRKLGIGLHLFTELTSYDSTGEALEGQMAYSVGTMLFFGIIRYTYDFRRLRETAQQLRIEKQAAELSYLKSQTNPHFLFNTLNNIYSLSRDKSDLAPVAILRLSELLRYMLYETSDRYVPLHKEVDTINHYLSLERLRYDDTLQVTFTTDLDNPGQPLPPLLLIPLVENAFKHGVSETRHQPFVHISLTVRQQQLNFRVENSVEEPTPASVEGIGLANLRRQLELLFTSYSLTTAPATSTFVATLTINLASHVSPLLPDYRR